MVVVAGKETKAECEKQGIHFIEMNFSFFLSGGREGEGK